MGLGLFMFIMSTFVDLGSVKGVTFHSHVCFSVLSSSLSLSFVRLLACCP